MRFYYYLKYYIILSSECILILDYDKYLVKKWSNMSLLNLVYGTIHLISVINKLFPLIVLKLEINIWYNYFFFLETVLCLLRYWIIKTMAHLMSQYLRCSPNPNYHREQHFFANSSYRVLHTISQNDLFIILVRYILIGTQLNCNIFMQI